MTEVDLDQVHIPDPVQNEISAVWEKLRALEAQIEKTADTL